MENESDELSKVKSPFDLFYEDCKIILILLNLIANGMILEVCNSFRKQFHVGVRVEIEAECFHGIN